LLKIHPKYVKLTIYNSINIQRSDCKKNLSGSVIVVVLTWINNVSAEVPTRNQLLFQHWSANNRR